MKKFLIFFSTLFLLLFIPLTLFFTKKTKRFFSKAAQIKANLTVDVKKITGPLPYNWKALAQGGEEQGVRMFEKVIYPISALSPRYIRIDHIYDFYNVVTINKNNEIVFNWDLLDTTVCDIYRMGAKPFFSLGYIPKDLSLDGSLTGRPKNWDQWTLLVQRTIERYSGKSTRICGQISGEFLKDIYYEVWNEPDHETFGKWSLYGGEKDYKLLYFYSSRGALQAQNVYPFFLGGPSTTAAYKNWFQFFLRFIRDNDLRIDFLSWHHYSTNPDDFSNDVIKINEWLSEAEFFSYRKLPKIISEWGYDSFPNPISETNIGAAHMIASIRNLIEEKLEMAFAFEIKDGLQPSWGLLTYNGEKKPRYHALRLLNILERYRLQVNGEGTFVKAIAAGWQNKITVVLTNYDKENKNIENVPIKIINLNPGKYTIIRLNLEGEELERDTFVGSQIETNILMFPNTTFAFLIEKTN